MRVGADANICATYLFLPFDDVRQLSVGDPGIELTFHQRGPFVIFYVAKVATLWHFDLFGEALWLDARYRNSQTVKQEHENNFVEVGVLDYTEDKK